MRPLALALLLLIPAAASAQSADDALVNAFVDGTPPAQASAAAPARDAVARLQREWKAQPASPGLAQEVEQAYALLVPKKDRPDLLERAKLTYGVGDPRRAQAELAALQARASRLPPGDKQRRQIAARMSKLSAALGRSQTIDDAGGPGAAGRGGVTAGGRDDAARRTALANYRAVPAGPRVRLDAGGPPPVDALPRGSVKFDGVVLNQRQQARVGSEVSSLIDVVNADSLQGYMTATDKRQLTDAWGRAVAHNVAADGSIPNMKKTVNDFRDILLNGRESGNGTTRVAEHWGEMAVGSYSVSPYAAIPASLLWNTFSITKGQLLRSYRYLRGQGPPPPAGNYWGEAMNKSLVTESAAAGWASALEGADHQSAIQGVVETLKLDEFAKYVKQNGLLTTAGQMKDRYSK